MIDGASTGHFGEATTTVTFDTPQLADKLEAAGIAPEQAAALARVILEARNPLLTKADLEIAPFRL